MSENTPPAIDLRSVPRPPLIAGALALITAFGTSQTWARALFIPLAGTDSDRGIITLILSLVIAGVCGWRLFFGLRPGWYFAIGLIAAAITLAMPVWFLVDVMRSGNGDGTFFKGRIISPSWALFLTIITAAGVIGALAYEFVLGFLLSPPRR